MIARRKIDVGKSAIDFYSPNHLIFGYMVYFLLHFLMLPFLKNYWILIISIMGATVWEALENSVWKNCKWRIYGIDSLENTYADILFGNIGSIICYFTAYLEICLFLFITIALLIVLMLLSEIIRCFSK